jgi:tungstate transport system permease protein
LINYQKIFEAISISLHVSVLSTLFAFLLSLILGYLIAINKFYFRRTLIAFLASLTSIPPVCAGLIVYLLISRSGPLGWMEILYTPSAMIIAQFFIIFPIMITLIINYIEEEYPRFNDELNSYGASKKDLIFLMIVNKKSIYMTVLLIGFGRAISEYGAAAIVGGSIDHVTRNMTSMIALETSKGNVLLGVILGLVLILFSLTISFVMSVIKKKDNV